MKNYISTPNLTLKRELNKKFTVLSIDEYRTSCIDHHTKERIIGNYKYKDNKNKTRKLHSVLTYKMENNRLGCMNQDKNSCYNIREIYNHYLRYTLDQEKEPRPKEYCHTKLEDKNCIYPP